MVIFPAIRRSYVPRILSLGIVLLAASHTAISQCTKVNPRAQMPLAEASGRLFAQTADTSAIVSDDQGTTWTTPTDNLNTLLKNTHPVGGSGNGPQMVASDNRVFFLTRESGDTAVTFADGQGAWKQAKFPQATGSMPEFAAATGAWLACFLVSGQPFAQQCTATRDNGQTWAPVALPKQSPSTFLLSTAGYIVVVQAVPSSNPQVNETIISRFVPESLTWKDVTPLPFYAPSAGFGSGIEPADSTILAEAYSLLASPVSYSKLAITTDGGDTWSFADNPTMQALVIGVDGAVVYSDVFHSRLLYSSDLAKTWHTLQLPPLKAGQFAGWSTMRLFYAASDGLYACTLPQ